MRFSVTTLVRLLLSIPLVWAQSIQVDWDREADFGKYESYAWETGADAPAKVSHDRLVQTIEDELGVNGIFKDEFEPDLYVIYYAARHDEFKIEGGGRSDWRDEGAVRVESFVEGTLVLDLIDAKKNRLVWRGVASDTVNIDPNKNADLIQRVVRELFEKFPAKE